MKEKLLETIDMQAKLKEILISNSFLSESNNKTTYSDEKHAIVEIIRSTDSMKQEDIGNSF